MTGAREMEHWPSYTTPNERDYTLKHVKLLEQTIGICKRFRTAVQAGGSIGYWPRRMAESFKRVITFEPEPLIYDCLARNLAALPNITKMRAALGEKPGRCGIERLSFGSHFVTAGDTTDIVPLDALQILDLDLLQLDIEGYEVFALRGAARTIERCRPVIQVEILGRVELAERDKAVLAFLADHGYRQVRQMARDYVFVPE